MPETMVRMGELSFSAAADDVLVALGLGSCIGLALIDAGAAVAGLAHVVLPASEGRSGMPGKFADTAVPALVDALIGLGARKRRLDAVLVGGASMFSFGGAGLDVGQRNGAAVREELERMRIRVVAEEIGGDRGRTVRVAIDGTRVTARAAGESEIELYSRARLPMKVGV